MSYINIDKALESIDLIAKNDGKKFDKDSARYAIQTTETEDVVPVVRCKGCKHYRDSTQAKGIKKCAYSSTNETDFLVMPDDFCNYGEMRADK